MAIKVKVHKDAYWKIEFGFYQDNLHRNWATAGAEVAFEFAQTADDAIAVAAEWREIDRSVVEYIKCELRGSE